MLRSDRTHDFLAFAYSPDGRWIASGGRDCVVNLWNAETGELLRTFRGHKGDVMRLRFMSSTEGLRLVSGSRDRTVNEALTRRTAAERAAVVLCCQNGLSHDEAARALGSPLGTVKTNVRRGKEKLRRWLEKSTSLLA